MFFKLLWIRPEFWTHLFIFGISLNYSADKIFEKIQTFFAGVGIITQYMEKKELDNSWWKKITVFRYILRCKQ